MRYCVNTRFAHVHKSATVLWENERSPERVVTYKQRYTMAQETWAARRSVPPKQTWGWAMRELDLSLQRGISDRFGMKTKAGCHRHNIPQTLEDAKQWQPLFGHRSGTDSGCTWKDSLGLQLRIPASFPKSTCSSLWPSTSLSEN